MKNRYLLALFVMCAPVWAQPPAPMPPKPAAPPISVADAEKLIGGPTTLTLHLKDAKLEQLQAELQRQTNFQVQLGDMDEDFRKQKINIDIEKQPFWSAMRAISGQLGLNYEIIQPKTLILSVGEAFQHRGVALPGNSLVRVALQNISRNTILDFTSDEAVKTGRGDQVTNLNAEFLLLLDPRLPVMPNFGRSGDVTLTTKSAEMQVNRQEVSLYNQGAFSWSLQVPLTALSKAVDKSVRMRGSMKFYVVTRYETWEVKDVLNAKAPAKTVRGPQGQETYTLRDVRKGEDGYRVQIAITRPLQANDGVIAEGAEELNQARFTLDNRAHLLDAAGVEYGAEEGAVDEENVREIIFSVQENAIGAKPGAPAKLVLDIPVEVRELEIPFDFKELPLP